MMHAFLRNACRKNHMKNVLQMYATDKFGDMLDNSKKPCKMTNPKYFLRTPCKKVVMKSIFDFIKELKFIFITKLN